MLTRIKQLINPRPRIGGLEIHTQGVRYCRIEGDRLVQASVPLEAGIISEGIIRDRGRFLAALKSLHLHISGGSQFEHVVAVVPAHEPEVEVFHTPRASGAALAEAVEIGAASHGGEGMIVATLPLGEADADVNRLNFLAASAPEASIRAYQDVLTAAGFHPVAIEFPAVSLTRFIIEKGSGLDFRQPYIVAEFTGDGICFLILIDGKLHGQEFIPWEVVQQEVGGHQIMAVELKPFILRAIKQLVLFAGTLGAQPHDLILIAPPSFASFMAEVQKNFSLQLHPLVVSGTVVPLAWAIAAGAALRTDQVSLSFISDSRAYDYDRLIGFVRRWRTIASATLFVLLALLVGGDLILAYAKKGVAEKLAAVTTMADGSEFVFISTDVERFNRLVSVAASMDAANLPLARFLERLIALGKTSRITYENVNIAADRKVTVVGSAATESAAIDFKNQLVAEPRFINVVLPLSGIATSSKGVQFSLSFEVQSFD